MWLFLDFHWCLNWCFSVRSFKHACYIKPEKIISCTVYNNCPTERENEQCFPSLMENLKALQIDLTLCFSVDVNLCFLKVWSLSKHAISLKKSIFLYLQAYTYAHIDTHTHMLKYRPWDVKWDIYQLEVRAAWPHFTQKRLLSKGRHF